MTDDKDLAYRYDRARGRECISIVGPLGGIHVWRDRIDGRYMGGVEQHTPATEGKPCWLLGTPCEHDGSSLYFEEYWGSRWAYATQADGADWLDSLFRSLRTEYRKRFEAHQWVLSHQNVAT